MVTVTDSAQEKIKDLIEENKAGPETAIRLTLSEQHPNMLELMLDRAGKDDKILCDSSGRTLLIIDRRAEAVTEKMVIDFRETTDGGSFTLENVQ